LVQIQQRAPLKIIRGGCAMYDQSAHYKYQELLNTNKQHAVLYFCSKQKDKKICIQVTISGNHRIVNDHPLHKTCHDLQDEGCLEHVLSTDRGPKGGVGKSVRVHFWRLTTEGCRRLKEFELGLVSQIPSTLSNRLGNLL
jgi:hypothetical protein